MALTGLFATTFPITVLTLAIPTIAEDFGVEEAGLAWLITLPMVASALALPILGKLGDIHGHRRVFLGGFALAMVFTALSATAADMWSLIAWRTLSQVSGTSTMPSSLALINTVHRGKRRAKAMGWWAMISAGAPVIGLTIGAPAIDVLGWPTLFLLQASLMVVPVIASWVVLRETPKQRARFDLPGALALAVGVGPLLLVVSEVRTWGVASVPTAACTVLAVVGLVAFVRIERHSQAPLVPMWFLQARATSSTLLVALFSSASYMGGFFLASLLIVQQFDYSLTSAVPILSIRPVLFAVMSPVGGWVTGRLGSRVSTIAGCVSLGGGLVGIALGSAADSLLIVVAVGFILQGTGYGLLRPGTTTALADAVDERDLGMAGASERLIGQLGVVFGITSLASIYASDVDRFPLAFAVGAGFAVLAAVAALGMAGTGRSSR